MPTIQSSYATNLAPSRAGAVADMIASDIVSRTVQTSAGIAFGMPVKKGTVDKTCVVWDGTGVIEGIVVRNRAVASGELYAQYESANVMVKGAVWVQASVAVAVDDQVYVTAAGAYTNVVGSNALLTGARFKTATTGAGLSIVHLK